MHTNGKNTIRHFNGRISGASNSYKANTACNLYVFYYCYNLIARLLLAGMKYKDKFPMLVAVVD